jgi:stringent starvation protein B
VTGIFAKETGYGFAFAVAAVQDPATALAAATAPQEPGMEAETPGPAGAARTDDKPKSRPSHLQVIK